MTKQEILNLNQLVYWLTLDYNVFWEQFHKYVNHETSFFKRSVFVNRNSPILYVAHIDTVMDISEPIEILINDKRVYATGMDDRLGCYLAFRLNLLGFNGDILICDHEEIELSTAKYFTTEKSYNWIVEFDKDSNDVITYGKSSKAFDKVLNDANFKISEGTYSDIKELVLPNNPSMFNMGIGYHNGESLFAYMEIEEFRSNVTKFAKFYNDHKNTKFLN